MIKLNCDMGESYGAWEMGDDQAIMPYIDYCNIACGGHAGDPQVMARTVVLAKQHQVEIGAHPGYEDLAGFGRRSLSYSPEQLYNALLAQLGALSAIANAYGHPLSYVKAHGALYNDMHQQPELFEVLLKASKALNPKLAVMIQAGPKGDGLVSLANHYGTRLIREAFSDRRYLSSGQLQSRSEPGSCLKDLAQIAAQAKQIYVEKQVTTAEGETISMAADTLCIHGDGPLAPDIAKLLSARNEKA